MIEKLKSLLKNIKIAIGFLLVAINTIVIFMFVLPVGLIKKHIKKDIVSRYCLKFLHGIGGVWIKINYIIIKLLSNIKYELIGKEKLKGLSKKDWYLVLSNHQSWNDVMILQFLFHKTLPFQKYLVKEKMRKFPIMGFIWESIDCPFLKRQNLKTDPNNTSSNKYSQTNEQIINDIDIIKSKCDKFKLAPAAIVSFPEGTRFSQEKHKQQDSPYKNLLKAKAGGVAAILEGLQREIKYIIDVTVCYQPRKFSFKDLFSGDINKVVAKVDVIKIPLWLQECYKNNKNYSEYKNEFQDWLTSIWEEKDEFMISNN